MKSLQEEIFGGFPFDLTQKMTSIFSEFYDDADSQEQFKLTMLMYLQVHNLIAK